MEKNILNIWMAKVNISLLVVFELELFKAVCSIWSGPVSAKGEWLAEKSSSSNCMMSCKDLWCICLLNIWPSNQSYAHHLSLCSAFLK